jgi:hypothetical protein
LQEIWLDSNQRTEVGFKMLAENGYLLQSLSFVNLSGNKIRNLDFGKAIKNYRFNFFIATDQNDQWLI